MGKEYNNYLNCSCSKFIVIKMSFKNLEDFYRKNTNVES